MLELIRKRNINWLGHWLRRNCLLKDALEGMVNGKKVRGRRYQNDRQHHDKWRYADTKRNAEKWLEHGCANHDTEGKRFKSPIHCCDVTKPPYLFSDKLCTSPLHRKLLFVYTVCCRRTGQCFSVLRTRKPDVILT